MNTLIVTGGDLSSEFALSFMKSHTIDKIIAVDRGLSFCYENKIMPDYVIGDYDSIDKQILSYYRRETDAEIETYQAEKDDTDTQIALDKAIFLSSSKIYILGAFGGRMDHCLANIHLLALALEEGVRTWLVDEHNVLSLIDEPTTIAKDPDGGYISFLPFTDKVEHITLRGFKYPLEDYCMTKGRSIGVSNEIVDSEATVTFTDGVLIMIQSRD